MTRRRTVNEDNLTWKDGIMISTPQSEDFDEVYKRNYTRLSQYAFHIIHDEGDAEDLANEAFLVYYQHTGEIEITNPDAYLFKILRNLIGNYIKQRDLHPTISLEILEETADPRSNSEPLERLLPQELNPDERKILILKLENGLTYAEIAPILGISEVSCRSRFFRAKAHFLLLTKKNEFF